VGIGTRAVVAGALLQGAPAAALALPPVARALAMTTSVAPDAFGLTFDDGPHPAGTPRILDVLEELDVRAAFFLTGEQVVRHPHVAAEIARRGHTVGVHGFRHVLLSVRTPWATAGDLDRACEAVERATGAAPRLFRPPYGDATPAALLAARRRGLRTVLWSRWGRDWERRATPASVAARATRDLAGGEVILLHDADHYSTPGSWAVTADALPEIVSAVRGRGLRLVPPS
jgi:peptidoglycan/xylan/chitin deacetylase (PgdA/CDA1 family)